MRKKALRGDSGGTLSGFFSYADLRYWLVIHREPSMKQDKNLAGTKRHMEQKMDLQAIDPQMGKEFVLTGEIQFEEEDKKKSGELLQGGRI